MGLRNIFKKTKKDKSEEEKEKVLEEKKAKVEEKKITSEKKKERKEEKKKLREEKEKERKEKSQKGKIDPNLYQVLIKPWITEKTSQLMAINQYVFKVSKDANKHQVKRAVEAVYGVKVVKVRIVNIPRKKKNLGRFSGWKPAFKKAIVTLREGDKIEIMPQ